MIAPRMFGCVGRDDLLLLDPAAMLGRADHRADRDDVGRVERLAVVRIVRIRAARRRRRRRVRVVRAADTRRSDEMRLFIPIAPSDGYWPGRSTMHWPRKSESSQTCQSPCSTITDDARSLKP